MKHTLDYSTLWERTIRVIPKLDMYANNNNLYVGLDYWDNDSNAWLPYTHVTVNVGELPYLHSTIDTNTNGKDIIDFLVYNGFGEVTDTSIPSGFCVFPVFKFDEDKLKEIDDVQFSLYAEAHGREVKQSLEEKISAAGKTAETVNSPDRTLPNKDLDR